MKIANWTNRIANVRKIKNSKKPMEYQIARLHEEASEMFMEVRRGGNLKKVTWKKDGDGIPKPYGFKAELGDAFSQLIHIADLAGINPDEAIALSVEYHELKQAATAAPAKNKKGKKK